MAGTLLFFGLHVWSFGRRHDLMYPWSDVLSVSTGDGRFHVHVAGEEHPDGFLFAVPAKHQERLTALLAERTLLHVEE